MRRAGQLYAPRRAGKRARARRRRGADIFLMLVMIGLSLLAISAGTQAVAAWRTESSPIEETGMETSGAPPAEIIADGPLGGDAGETPAVQGETGSTLSGAYDFSKPVPLSDPVDAAYFDDAVFIGDSRTEGLFLNTALSNATSFAHMGLMVDTVFTRPLFNIDGEKVPVIDALRSTDFSKVYIMLGINETGWIYSSIFIQKYGELIDAIREIDPDAIIYIQAIMPVSQTVSDTHSYIKNAKIGEYDQLLQQLAEERQVYYIDTACAVAGEDGALPEDAAPDGIHLVRSYCERWLEYLMAHTAPSEKGEAAI